MAYPTLEQYQEVLQHPKTALIDPTLSTGSIQMTGLGLPLAMCGGFALTYTVSSGSRKFAVRCFHKESNGLDTRYQAISKRLQSLQSKYFVDFEFQSKGVRVNGNTFPVVKMAWASGTTFGEFIESHYRDKVKLNSLVTAFRDLSSYLESKNLAHGDIQPGNVMVGGNGSAIQLIDYDGMYVDEIQKLGSAEIGHRSFQHPLRTGKHFSPLIDRFALIALNLSLRALQVDPSLWNLTQSEADSILFRPNDYDDPASSKIFLKLSSLPTLARDVKNFASICKSAFEKIPSLDDFIAGNNIPQQAITFSANSANEIVRAYISQYSVLDASDYSIFARNIGQMVELIGQIVEVSKNVTRRGRRPYVFINFGNWRGTCVKLAIWSEVLEKMSTVPNESWIGRWVSVKGLVDAPYHSKQYGYTHIGVTITSPHQLNAISTEEAKYRLRKNSAPNLTELGNTEVLKGIKNVGQNTSKVQPIHIPPRPQPPVSNNQRILQEMQAKAAASQSTSPSQPVNHRQVGATKPTTTQPHVVTQPKQNPAPSKNGVPWWIWLVGLFFLYLFFKR